MVKCGIKQYKAESWPDLKLRRVGALGAVVGGGKQIFCVRANARDRAGTKDSAEGCGVGRSIVDQCRKFTFITQNWMHNCLHPHFDAPSIK